MKITHTVGSFGKASYGLGSISIGLAKAQLELGEDISVWSSDTEETILWSSENYGFPRERLFGFPQTFPFIKASCKEIRKASNDKSIDIVHQHSLWTSQSIITSILRDNGAKTIIAAHGTLAEHTLENSKLKKKIALSLFERRNLEKASVLHATSEYEIEDFRRLGLKNPIAYIENGVGSKALLEKGNGDQFKSKYHLPKDKKVLLYLSRITPKKGLDMLLPAVSELQEKFNEWILVIVGNNEFNYQPEVEAMINALQLNDKVFIIEPQFGAAKYNVFEASDFFILPSYSEGSPMVIVEALAYGLPVITTKSSSWRDLNDFHTGFWVDINKDHIKQALKSMTDLSDEELNQYSNNAKKLIKKKYLWDEISKKTIELYEWIAFKGDKPDFIY
ncbi:glycosyltransferase [Chryseobacterium salviniae]|uniref:Glycosyltransferase n=1 Tax=Chryseobacterium salviniae TaxID=3101750 RepID=A0ABU6HX22_9FLAO|nr:glycosyltransferase [Chryseobacterium sp. T9W2-O]MEC3877609.1 glycosyltransferase [Chryseobacterium sp. T9W2-O]